MWRFYVKIHNPHAHFHRTRRHASGRASPFSCRFCSCSLFVESMASKQHPPLTASYKSADTLSLSEYRFYRIGYYRGFCPSYSGWDRLSELSLADGSCGGDLCGRHSVREHCLPARGCRSKSQSRLQAWHHYLFYPLSGFLEKRCGQRQSAGSMSGRRILNQECLREAGKICFLYIHVYPRELTWDLNFRGFGWCAVCDALNYGALPLFCEGGWG